MRTYLRWWLRQLAELLPRGLAQLSSSGPDAVILDVSSEKIAVLIRQRRALRSVQTVRADRAGFARIADMLAAQRDAPRPLLLRVPLAQCLRKEITLPLAAEGDLDTLLGYEMDRETPFAKDEVYWGYRMRRRDVAHGRLEIDLRTGGQLGPDTPACVVQVATARRQRDDYISAHFAEQTKCGRSAPATIGAVQDALFSRQ